MAVTWKVDNERGSVYMFDPAHIVVKGELNGRFELPDIEELKASILAEGQLQPVIVRKEAEKPVLMAGFSRWRAICEINEGRKAADRLKIAAVFARCNEQDGYIRNWEENHRRNATTALDDAHHFAQLEKWGMSVKAIAERLKVSPALVSKRLKLIETTPEVQAAVKNGRLNPNAAVQIGKLAAKEQREAVKGNGKVEVSTMTHRPAKPSLRAVVDYVKRADSESDVTAVKLFCADLLEFLEGK